MPNRWCVLSTTQPASLAFRLDAPSIAQARAALAAGRAEEAVQLCQAALGSPENLGEAKHLLANDSDVRYALGCAFEAAGRQVG